MNISELVQSYQDLSGEQANHINEYVARALLHVVHTHIMTVTPSLVLILCCRNQHTCNFYNEMMIILFRSWGIAPLQIVNVVEGMPRQYIPGRRHFNLIFTDSYAAFAEIEVEAYSRDYAYNEHYYIFLQARDHLMFAEMGRIFEHCWRHQLINCNVQVQRANGDILVYTYQPFGAHSCANMTPQLINRYNGSHMLHPKLYPRKLTNFFGCPLRVALWHMPPYCELSGSGSGSGNDSDAARITGGIEGRLLQTMSQRLNLSIQIRTPPPGRLPLRERMLEMLHRDEADFTVGAIRPTVAYSQLATSSHNYYQTSLRFGFLRDHYELSSLDVLLYPYPTIIWFGILLVFAVSLLLHLAMDRELASDPVSLWLNVELIFVGMAMVQIPRSDCKRLYCIMLMVYSLLIRTVYQGMLYHLIRTHQLNRLPQSIEELVADNYTVVISSGMYDVLAEIPVTQHMRFLTFETEATLLQPLLYFAEHPRVKRQVVASVVDIFHIYNRLTSYTARVEQRNGNQFEILSQDVINMQMSMYLRKHSFLVDEFNEQIMWMRSVGLLSIWTHWELDSERDSRSDQVLHFKMLGLQELYALFVLVLVGMAVSTVIFILELISQRSARLQRWFVKS